MKKILHFFILIFVILPICCVYAALNNTQNTAQNAAFSPQQTQQIQQIVYHYLIQNPQIMIEMAKKLQQQAEDKEKTRIKAETAKYSKEIFNPDLGGRMVLGNPKGKIILAEFLSYECPHCKVMGKFVNDLVKTNPDLQVILIYWPFQGNDAIYAVEAVIASEQQNKFAQLHEAFMEYPDYLSKDNIDKVIVKNGVNMDRLQKNIKQQKNAVDNGLKNNFKLATKMKLIGTPVFIAANSAMTKFSVVPGQATEADLKHAIDEVR